VLIAQSAAESVTVSIRQTQAFGEGQEEEKQSQQVKRHSKGLIQPLKFLGRKSPDKIGQSGLRETHQFIAMDAALMFHAFINPNWDLRGKPVVLSVDRGTDDR
jgi:hypothetical protein